MPKRGRATPKPAPNTERAFRWPPAQREGTARLDPWRERDACGVGFIAHASGTRSHDVVQRALTAVARLAHRGAAATDHSGDGAGVLTQIPHRLLAGEAGAHGISLPAGRPFAVGMFFLPREEAALQSAVGLVEEVFREAGMAVLAWRDVPTNSAALGDLARASCPTIRQALVAPPAGGTEGDAWERALYVARRTMEQRASESDLAPFHVSSLSCRTVAYKALLTGTELPTFYPDLRSPAFESAVAVFHQRYSTNTAPSWPLAQPFRMLAHNGEINTLWGNRNAMLAREPALASPAWGEAIERLKPIIWRAGSDSTSLDNVLELLVLSGRDPVHALMMLVPEAWERATDLDPELRSFYQYHAGLMEPWDGPAAVAFTDGRVAGSVQDRNGLRPCRYKITRDGLVVAASEVGVADLDPADVMESGRLGPGELLVVDLERGAILHNFDAKRVVARRHPYERWASRTVRALPVGEAAVPDAASAGDLVARQRAFGYTFEDLRYVLEPMGHAGQEAIWSMGDDTPMPPLSRFPRSLYDYFRQRFAQVTNPAIDPLRETLVMSLAMHLGRRGSILAQRPLGRPLLRL